MIDAHQFREIVSGHRRGLVATIVRAALLPAAAVYGGVIYLRNGLFKWRVRPIEQVSIPVISVGNLTVGGTGKTPFVLWLAQWLERQGIRPAVLSRGYGAQQGQFNDEALELQQHAPNLCHLQSGDRVRSARRAISEFAAQVLILDDGFQHRRLARDLDIVLIDASEPFGYGHLLPRGLLREPLSSLRRAGAIVLTRANLASAEVKQNIRRIVARHNQTAVWAEATFSPSELQDDRGATQPLQELRSAKVFGFAAIGQPDNFRRSLQALSGKLIGFRSFPDHHQFSQVELRELVATAQSAAADVLVCTCKDLVKIPAGGCSPMPLRAVRIETLLTTGRADFEQLVRSILAQREPVP